MSVRWHHCIDHADTKQKPLMGPDCLLGVVPQPTDSRLSETTYAIASATREVAPLHRNEAVHLDSIELLAKQTIFAFVIK